MSKALGYVAKKISKYLVSFLKVITSLILTATETQKYNLMGKYAGGLKVYFQKIRPVPFIFTVKPYGTLLHKEMPGKETKKKKKKGEKKKKLQL